MWSRRLTAHRLAAQGSNMPCAAGTLSVGPDNLDFRRRRRRAHPGTEAAMSKQREACIWVRSVVSPPLRPAAGRLCQKDTQEKRRDEL